MMFYQICINYLYHISCDISYGAQSLWKKAKVFIQTRPFSSISRLIKAVFLKKDKLFNFA